MDVGVPSFHSYLLRRQSFESSSPLKGISPRPRIRSFPILNPALNCETNSDGQKLPQRPYGMTKIVEKPLPSSSSSSSTSSSSKSSSSSSFSSKIIQPTQCEQYSSTIPKSKRLQKEMKKPNYTLSPPCHRCQNFSCCSLRNSFSLNDMSRGYSVQENKEIPKRNCADSAVGLLEKGKKCNKILSLCSCDFQNYLYLKCIPEET